MLNRIESVHFFFRNYTVYIFLTVVLSLLLILGLVFSWEKTWSRLIEVGIQDNYQERLLTHSVLPLVFNYLKSYDVFYASPLIETLERKLFERQWTTEVQNMGFWSSPKNTEISMFMNGLEGRIEMYELESLMTLIYQMNNVKELTSKDVQRAVRNYLEFYKRNKDQQSEIHSIKSIQCLLSLQRVFEVTLICLAIAFAVFIIVIQVLFFKIQNKIYMFCKLVRIDEEIKENITKFFTHFRLQSMSLSPILGERKDNFPRIFIKIGLDYFFLAFSIVFVCGGLLFFAYSSPLV